MLQAKHSEGVRVCPVAGREQAGGRYVEPRPKQVQVVTTLVLSSTSFHLKGRAYQIFVLVKSDVHYISDKWNHASVSFLRFIYTE